MQSKSQNDLRFQSKFIDGIVARNKWKKDITKNVSCNISQYNESCGNMFEEVATIVLEPSTKKRATIDVVVKQDKLEKWNTKKEYIYIITRNEEIMKIGGTRDGMKGRWSSYGCGYYVPQRLNKNGEPYPGKMSVTNAHLYHTIEEDLLENNSSWKFYIWDLPVTHYDINILGKSQKVIAQTYHAYETCCIEQFKSMNGTIPILCDNCDPRYK
jgi:hypothetical protein